MYFSSSFIDVNLIAGTLDVSATGSVVRQAIDATAQADLGQAAAQAVSQTEQALSASEAAVVTAVQQAGQAQEQVHRRLAKVPPAHSRPAHAPGRRR